MNLIVNIGWSLLFATITVILSLAISILLSGILTLPTWGFFRGRSLGAVKVASGFVEFLVSTVESIPVYFVFLLIFYMVKSLNFFENIGGYLTLSFLISIFLSPKFIRLIQHRTDQIYSSRVYPYQLIIFGIKPFKVMWNYVFIEFVREMISTAMAAVIYVISLEAGIGLIVGTINWGQASYLKRGVGYEIYWAIRYRGHEQGIKNTNKHDGEKPEKKAPQNSGNKGNPIQRKDSINTLTNESRTGGSNQDLTNGKAGGNKSPAKIKYLQPVKRSLSAILGFISSPNSVYLSVVMLIVLLFFVYQYLESVLYGESAGKKGKWDVKIKRRSFGNVLEINRVEVEGAGLRFSYKKAELIDADRNVSFLMGPSGSGKSLLIKAMMDMLPEGFSAKGQLQLYLDRLRRSPDSLWKVATYLPQEPALYLYPYYTVDEWTRIRYGYELKDLFSRYRDLQGNFRYGDFRDKYPDQLSGGMKRLLSMMFLGMDVEREGIRMAFLDEPEAALDIVNQINLFNYIRKISRGKQDVYLLIVSHQPYFPVMVKEKEDPTVLKLRPGREGSIKVERSELCDIVEKFGQEPEHEKEFDNLLKGKGGESHAILNVEDLKIGYIRKKFCIKIPPRTLNFVLGRNGTGKSSLLKAIFNIIPHSAQRVEMKGEDVSRLSPHEFKKRNILLILEDIENALPQHVPLKRILIDIARTVKSKKGEDSVKKMERIWNRAFGKYRWNDLGKRTFQSFSGGERQRIILQVVLSFLEPELVFLDEPFNRIDFDTLCEIFAGQFHSYREGRKFHWVIVTHNLFLVGRLLSRLKDEYKNVFDEVSVRYLFEVERYELTESYKKIYQKFKQELDNCQSDDRSKMSNNTGGL